MRFRLRRARLLAVAVAFGALAAVGMARAADDGKSGENAAPCTRRVRYSLTLKNTTGKLLDDAALFVAAPLEATSFQQRIKLNASHAYRLLSDADGNQVLHFRFRELPPYAVKQVTVESELQVRDRARAVAVETNTLMGAGWLVEIDDPAFSELAPRFEQAQAMEKARAIFDWTRKYVRDVGYYRRDRGALYALRKKQGDCTELMALFVALCRLNGIPARCLGGYVCTHDCVLHSQDYHNWAEFYTDGTWHVADPQRGRFAVNGGQYLATRVYGGTTGPLGRFGRFRYEGEGLSVTMNR